MVSLDFDIIYPELYFSGEDLAALPGKEITITIYEVKLEQFTVKGTSRKEPRVILFFEEARSAAKKRGQSQEQEKRVIVNKPMKRVLKRLFGKDPRNLVGKKVRLWAEFGKWFGEERHAIRVRPVLIESAAPQSATEPAEPEPTPAAEPEPQPQSSEVAF